MSKIELKMKCSKCKYVIQVNRNTFLEYDDCPECGKSLDYAKTNTTLLLTLIDSFGEMIELASSMKENDLEIAAEMRKPLWMRIAGYFQRGDK